LLDAVIQLETLPPEETLDATADEAADEPANEPAEEME
jgi:hypothetical protein